MHPLRTFIESAVANGIDFMLVLGGTPELRVRMGLPRAVAERNPLLFTLPAHIHPHAHLVPDDVGLSCMLSFDSLYECRLPWSCIQQIVLMNREEPTWPRAWDPEAEAPAAPEAPSPPDNVRVFRPRGKKPDSAAADESEKPSS